MDAYLVLLRHTMDDLPVRLFPHTKKGRRDALLFAGGLAPMPTKAVRNVFETDCSTPVCAWVIEYQDGVPAGRVGSFEFDDDDRDDVRRAVSMG